MEPRVNDRTVQLPQAIRVERPCSVSWGSMEDRGKTRWCGECGLHVHDLTQLTATEAATLLAGNPGRLCVSSISDSSGRLLTRDDRWRLRRAVFLQRMTRFAALLGLGSAAALIAGCVSRTAGKYDSDRTGGSVLRTPADAEPPAQAPTPR